MGDALAAVWCRLNLLHDAAASNASGGCAGWRRLPRFSPPSLSSITTDEPRARGGRDLDQAGTAEFLYS